MPVEEADRLLKAAGFRGGYTQVTMFKWPAEGLLEWLFWGLDLEGNGYGNIVTVDVMTGEVKFLEMEGLKLGGLGMGS